MRRAHLPAMTRPVLLALLFLAASAPAAQALAGEQPAPAAQALQGQTVRGARGVVLGVVERVVTAPDGHATQILVRPKGMRPGGARSLSVAGVAMAADGVATPITKAEFDAMPSVDLSDH